MHVNCLAVAGQKLVCGVYWRRVPSEGEIQVRDLQSLGEVEHVLRRPVGSDVWALREADGEVRALPALSAHLPAMRFLSALSSRPRSSLVPVSSRSHHFLVPVSPRSLTLVCLAPVCLAPVSRPSECPGPRPFPRSLRPGLPNANPKP